MIFYSNTYSNCTGPFADHFLFYAVWSFPVFYFCGSRSNINKRWFINYNITYHFEQLADISAAFGRDNLKAYQRLARRSFQMLNYFHCWMVGVILLAFSPVKFCLLPVSTLMIQTEDTPSCWLSYTIFLLSLDHSNSTALPFSLVSCLIPLPSGLQM